MRKDISVYACLRTDLISKKTGKAPINLRVKVYREEAKFPTIKHVTKEEWDTKRQLPKNNLLRKFITESIAKLETHLLTEQATEGDISMQTVRDFFAGKKKTKPEYEPFYPYFLEHIERVKKEGKAPDTIRIYENTLNFLKEFKPNLKVSDINLKFVEDFDTFLRDKKGNADGGRENKHKNLRSVILYLQKHGIPINNPYGHGGFKIPKAQKKDIYLEMEEIEALRGLVKKYEKNTTERNILQMFLFSCFTGLRISDVISLKWSEIDVLNKQIVKIQQKTKDEVEGVLEPWAIIALADFTKAGVFVTKPNTLVFPQYAQNTIRYYLKRFAAEVGIEKNVTCHVARHSFGTLQQLSGTDISTIAKLLGHKDIKTTIDIYLNGGKQLVKNYKKSGGIFKNTSTDNDKSK